MTFAVLRRILVALVAGGVALGAIASGPYEGEVRTIDKSAAKITLKHGPLAKLDMPPMTMVFQVKNKALLDAIKPGDKVRFDAERAGGLYYVTQIEPVR